ncbi:MAG TPA: Ig-like domain-containing protein, partial [Polyangiaceae bacterium LLY-WYZ-15_(1-7)]|nr:Ig-like domain-containing protein [Polyangiaceae bacterium LLY-WYZ-15_(1-7)]
GGSRLFHLDVTLPTDPEVVEELALLAEDGAEDPGHRLLAADGLLYVSSDEALRIYREGRDGLLERIARIDASALGGAPGALVLRGDTLWVAVPEASRLALVDLRGGSFDVRGVVETRDRGGRPVAASDLALLGELLLVATGDGGSVIAFPLRAEGVEPAAELAVLDVGGGGRLSADRLAVAGPILYLAAGDGDLQLFDIGAWRDFDFGAEVPLVDYFGTLGAVRGLGLGRGATYAGTAYLRDVDGEPVENPVACEGGESCHGRLGGALATFVDDALRVLETRPAPRGLHGVEDAVEVQLDRIVDPGLIEARGAELFEVTRGGVPVAGFVSTRVTPPGTRLLFRPVTPFEPGVQYGVRVSAELEALRGARLGRDYRFRFTATAELAPALLEVTPAFGSWRGEAEVRLVGEGFGPETEVRFAGVPAEVLRRDGSELLVRTGAFPEASEDSRLVGVEVRNGDRAVFRPASFTYVADPAIDAIGLWEGGRIEGTELRYDRGELVGVRGRGVGPATLVRVNGRPVEGVERIDDETLVFPAPGRTVGRLRVALENGPEAVAESEALEVLFEADWRDRDAAVWDREGSLFVAADRDEVRLYAAVEEAAPELLAFLPQEEPVVDVALGGGALLLAMESGELRVLDLSDVYSPRLEAVLPNPGGVAHEDLAVSGRRFVSADPAAGEVHVGLLGGAAWESLAVPDLVEVAVDGEALFVLTEGALDVRALAEPSESLLVDGPVTLETGTLLGLRAEAGRVAIWGRRGVEVFRADGVAELGALELLGAASSAALGFGDTDVEGAAMTGEVLAVLGHRGLELRLFDVGPGDGLGGLDAREVARVAVPTRADTLELEGGHLGWSGLASAWSLQLPLAQVVAAGPARLASPDDTVRLAVGGDPEAWGDAIVGVTDLRSGASLGGSTRYVDGELSFAPVGAAFAPGELYEVALLAPPADRVDGGRIVHDLSHRLPAAPLFGAAPLELRRVTPSTAVTGEATTFVAEGAGLHAVTALRLGGVEVAGFAASPDGTELSFDAVPGPGVLSLEATHEGGREVLPAAVLGAEALVITAVTTPTGDSLSVGGGTRVTVTGAGLARASIHLVAAASGALPGAGNRVAVDELLPTGVGFGSPPCVAGTVFDLVATRAETGDEVRAPGVLRCVDDVAPRLVSSLPYAPGRPARFEFDEPVDVGAWAVRALVEDYDTPGAVEDVSARFELRASGRVVELALRAGETLADDRRYTFALEAVSDAAGNAPTLPIEQSWVAPDRLAPRDLGLTLAVTGERLGEGVGRGSLVGGQRYRLAPVAMDNRDVGRDVALTTRVSRDGGATFGSVVRGELELDVAEADLGFVFRVEARDRSGNRASEDVTVGVAAPDIAVGAVTTAPASPEEETRVRVAFTVSGADVGLVDDAEVRILSRAYRASERVVDTTTREYAIDWDAPTLAELRAATGGSDEVPVALTLRYGAAGRVEGAGSFTLHEDLTPPEIAVVSPADGAAVPTDEPLEVLLRVFDAHGIERVEVEVDGAAPVVLSDPTRFELTPAGTAPTELRFTATDLAGNAADETLTLRPYDDDGEAPRLAILAPSEGAEVREREALRVDVELDQLTEARLHVDLGGDPAHPGNPEPILLARGEDDPERFPVSLTIPPVDRDLVAVLRLVHDGGPGAALVDRRSLQVRDDDAVSETLALEVFPAGEVLGGSEVWARATAPDAMEDFDPRSELRFEDPVGVPLGVEAVDGRLRGVRLPEGDGDAAVVGLLRDRSGNEARFERALVKQAYLGGEPEVLFDAGVSGRVGPVVALSTWAGERVLFAVESAEGGWALRDGAGVVDGGAEGHVVRLEASGALVVAELERGGEHVLRIWPREAAGL